MVRLNKHINDLKKGQLAVDRNEDGKVSKAEIVDTFKEGGDDEDGPEDKKKTEAQKQADLDHIEVKFEAADANKDGHLDHKELAIFMHPEVHTDEMLELEAKKHMKEYD